jgi:beta-glucosidase
MPKTARADGAKPAAQRPPVDERDLGRRAATLSLGDKVCLLTGGDLWSLHAKPSAGLRRIVVSDGPVGVRGERWDERDTSANVPCPTALAASWDEQLVQAIGRVLAAEARRKGVDVLLAPTLNLHRTPYGGRHFECFSEDPLLTARIGAAYIRGVQSGGVAATAKHFIANETETQRHTVDVRVDDRTLHEVYLAPFEAAIRSGVWAVMAAYNRVNGSSMTESDLLHDVLDDELGFDGVVMSDWFATRTTEASARAALDLVMPGPDGPWGQALLDAIDEGRVAEATVDGKVRRVLRLAARVGALDEVQGMSPPSLGPGELAGTLRRAAAAGFVLVRNRGGLLPLARGRIRRLAVIGRHAADPSIAGGGSAKVFPPYCVSPLAGLRAALSRSSAVDYAPAGLVSDRVPVAAAPWIQTPDGVPGAEVRFLSSDGTVLGSERRPACAFNYPRSLEHGGSLAWVEVRATVRATEPGVYTIGASGLGRYRLTVGGNAVFDGRLTQPPGSDPFIALLLPPQVGHPVALDRGEQLEVVLRHEVGTAASELGDIGLAFQLNLLPPHGTDEEELARAERLARQADAAIVVVGTTDEVESEGFDRSTLGLPGRQDELVRRVAAANPRTVVVVNAGAPVLMPWAEDVGAVLLAWFPGQEFGNALADVVFGDVEPGGRLPTTWPRTEEGLPTARPAGGRLDYAEGLSIGYRGVEAAARSVRYPFGHGLGYSQWVYEELRAPEAMRAGEPIALEVVVRNTGRRLSREVVQAYASRPDSVLERPERWLAGFARAEAGPGERVTVTLTIAPRAVEHWDTKAREWALEPGRVELAVGPSSQLLPLGATVRIPAAARGDRDERRTEEERA